MTADENRQLDRLIASLKASMIDVRSKPHPDNHEIVVTAGELRLLLGGLADTELDSEHWLDCYNRLNEKINAEASA